MTWPYIAGFFDGEGCLHSLGAWGFNGSEKGRFRVTIAQSLNIGRDTLQEIADFLSGYGIYAYVLPHTRSKEKIKPHHRQVWDLMITRQESVRMFIEGVFPYLRIKRQRAEDYRRLCILMPKLTGCTQKPRVSKPEFIRLVESGVGYGDIARRFGLDHSGVLCRAKRLGLHVDSRTESNRKRAKVPLEDLRRDYAELGSYAAVARKNNLKQSSVWERLNTN